MAFDSNTHSVQIVTASSALASAAAAMVPGSWAPFTTNNLNAAFLVPGGSTGNMIAFLNCGAWDPVHGLVHVVDQDHGGGGLRHVQYTESTNTWSVVIANGLDGGHAYDHLNCDPTNGDLYLVRYGTAGIAKKPFGSPWNLGYVSGLPFLGNITYGSCLWTGALTGLTAGRIGLFVWSQYFGDVAVWDITTGTLVIDEGASGANGGYHAWAAYSAVHNCVVYGGGNDSLGNNFGKQVRRYNSNRTVTVLTAPPDPVRLGAQQGSLSEDPVTGNFIVMSQNQIWELNPTGSGTWTEQTGARAKPAAVNSWTGNDPNAACVIPIHTYGVTMVVSADAGSSANVYLYKHA